MAEEFIGELEERCEGTIEHFKREIARVRSGRANTGILEGLTVDYYGSSVPLVQLGLISAPEPRLLTVQVYDGGAIESVEKAIQQADLGLNPSREGNMLRINIPALTEDRRKELVKKLHKLSEESKVGLRSHRRDILDGLKKQEKAKEISEDDLHRAQDEVQKVTDRFTAQVDELLQSKETEMMEV